MDEQRTEQLYKQIIEYMKKDPLEKYAVIMEKFGVTQQQIREAVVKYRSELLDSKNRRYESFLPKNMASRRKKIMDRRSPKNILSSSYYHPVPLSPSDDGKWTYKEYLDLILEVNKDMSREEIAKAHNRDEKEINMVVAGMIEKGYILEKVKASAKAQVSVKSQTKAQNRPVSEGQQLWSDEEVAKLIEEYNSGLRQSAIAPLHGRTVKSVGRKIEKLRKEGKVK